MLMVARFHHWLQNILVVNNRWRQVALEYFCGYTIALASISLFKLGKY